MKLLIHHHTRAYVDEKGIWLQSFIGSWVRELSKYFSEIGLLINVSNTKMETQDYLVSENNVVAHNYNCKSRRDLNKNIITTCRNLSFKYDILIIRGITPKQKIVFDNCRVNRKAFLLVGSIKNSKPVLKINKRRIIEWFLYWVRIYQLKKIAKSSKIYANSKAAVDELFNFLNINASVIPTNTISNTDFIPFQQKKISSPINLLFCGRVREDKGIEELIKALSLVLAQGYFAKLEIVGDCSKSYKDKLKTLIENLELSSNVTFRGFVEFGDKLFDFYKGSDIYILPSWHEGFPHSIWEAAANCIPVITTSVGGIPSILGRKHVLFCRVKNSKSIADCIIQTIEDPVATCARLESLYSLAQNYSSERCAEIMYNIVSGSDV